MHTKLSSNQPLEDYENEDVFDFKPKADAIKEFLEFGESLEKNKMIALYGNWGSGKTSLMRYIQGTISTDIYHPVFFEAWKYEKDDNLALSLFDAISAEVDQGWLDLSAIRKNAIKVLKGFSSAINVKLSTPIRFIEVEFNGKEFTDTLIDDGDSTSFFKADHEFKNNFRKLEEKLCEQKNTQKILVFVDDLDRCEPENVLNLITALKLFFTYGNKSIYITGIDKDAVTKAVKTKYQDVIKSDEYLEKVFDVSFGMPKTFELTKLLDDYFPNPNTAKIISHFLQSVHFINPRHIKKILNKYEILVTYKFKESFSQKIRSYIPNILFKKENESGNVFETIFCLFFIILYEYFPNKFEELEHYKRKQSQLHTGYINYQNKIGKPVSNEWFNARMDYLEFLDFENVTLSTIFPKNFAKSTNEKYAFFRFILYFSKSNPLIFTPIPDNELSIDSYAKMYNEDDILTLFCKFLIKHEEEITMNEFGEYKLADFIKMAKYLL